MSGPLGRSVSRLLGLTLLLGLGWGAPALGAPVRSLSAPNRYGASLTVSSHRAGSVAHPAPLGLREQIAVSPVSGPSAAPLSSLSLSVAGVGATAVGFPVCTVAAIDAVHDDTVCPAGALVASAQLTSALSSPAQPSQSGVACLETLALYNAGPGRLTAFMRFPRGQWCDDLHTGAIPAWSASLRQAGANLTLVLPFPTDVFSDTAGTGLVTGLNSVALSFRRLTESAGDATLGYLDSTGCRRGRRRSARLLLSTGTGSSTQTSVIRQSTAC